MGYKARTPPCNKTCNAGLVPRSGHAQLLKGVGWSSQAWTCNNPTSWAIESGALTMHRMSRPTARISHQRVKSRPPQECENRSRQFMNEADTPCAIAPVGYDARLVKGG